MSPGLDRDKLLRAASLIDMLAAGWEPGAEELDAARRTECPAIVQDHPGQPHRFLGALYPFPPNALVIVAPVIAIDPAPRWAHIGDEWIVVASARERPRCGEPTHSRADAARRETHAEQINVEARRRRARLRAEAGLDRSEGR